MYLDRAQEPRWIATLVTSKQPEKKSFYELHPNMMISKIMHFTPAGRFFAMAGYVLASVISIGLFVGLDFAINYQKAGVFKTPVAAAHVDLRTNDLTYNVVLLPPVPTTGGAGADSVPISEVDDESDDSSDDDASVLSKTTYQYFLDNQIQLALERVTTIEQFEHFLKGIPPHILRQSPTPQNPLYTKAYQGLPLCVRPEFLVHTPDDVESALSSIAFCFPTFESINAMVKFLKDSGSTGVVEVGPGTGLWGQIIRNLEINYHGHSLKNPLTEYRFTKSFLPPECTTSHETAEDISYLFEAGEDGKTLFLCFPEAEEEEQHNNKVGINSAQIYFEGCKKGRKQATIILVGDSCSEWGCTGGPLLDDFLSKNFKLQKNVAVIGHWFSARVTMWCYTADIE